MSSKAKCYQLAKQHNLEIVLHRNAGTIESSINLPEGFQLSSDDNRQGLVGMAENSKELWKGIYSDLLEIISNEPFFPIPQDLSCQLCGEQITDKQGARVFLPWGDTCAPCVKQIKEVKKNNGNL